VLGTCLLVCVLAACESTDSEPEPETTAAATEVTEPLEEAPPAPEEVTDVDADSLPRALREHPGRVLLVNVWATYCAPCVEEMPELVSVGRRYRQRGLGLMLISADQPARRGAALVFLRGQGAPFPSYIRSGPEERFNRTLEPRWSGELPATLLLDADRRVVHFWERPVDVEMLRPAIENALAAGPT